MTTWLVTGGARSGKSAQALRLAMRYSIAAPPCAGSRDRHPVGGNGMGEPEGAQPLGEKASSAAPLAPVNAFAASGMGEPEGAQPLREKASSAAPLAPVNAFAASGPRYAPRVFIATATAGDDEMRDRITRHRAERGDAFMTIEEPLDLAGALDRLPTDTSVALIDCVTVWVANLMGQHGAEIEDFPELDALLERLRRPLCHVILVTNEVGMGIVPENALARRFRDLAGRANQRLAAVVDRVVFMVSGIALTVKPAGGPTP